MIERFFDSLLHLIKKLKYIYLRIRTRQRIYFNRFSSDKSQQDLAVYSDPNFVHAVSCWGSQTAWSEILFLLTNCKGKILDIACGPCTLYPQIERLPYCDYYGCDISDFLISKAIEAGVPPERVKVCDATQTPFRDGAFDHAYTIGSLEHFTEAGIIRLLEECRRITKQSSFHQIPISRSGRNEGWIKLDQSYFNNPIEWWLEKFQSVYAKVHLLDSSWEDAISVGKWFICH